MQPVAVVGAGGAGKSTFANALAERTGLPVIHLDRWYWRPGWVEPAKADWEALQADLVAGERWIIDGNYGGSLDVRLRRADTVIILAPPRLVCVVGAFTRVFRYRGRAVQAPGCPERFSFSFLRWIWRYPMDSRPRLDSAIGRHPHLRVLELTSRHQAKQYLKQVGPV